MEDGCWDDMFEMLDNLAVGESAKFHNCNGTYELTKICDVDQKDGE